MTDSSPPEGAESDRAQITQSGQAKHSPQTNVTGNVQGPILSGEFHDQVNVGDTTVENVTGTGHAIGPGARSEVHYHITPAVALVAGAIVIVALIGAWGLGNVLQTGETATPRTATLAPSPPPTLTPAPTSTPALQTLASLTLLGRRLVDVVAANGQVWLATDQGLFYAEARSPDEPQSIANVPYALSALAVDGASAVVWFSRSDVEAIAPNEGLIGRYNIETGQVDWFPPPPYNEVAFKDITTIQIGRAGEVWFGNYYGVVAQLQVAGSNWQFHAVPADLPPVLHIYDLAVDPADRSVVWMAGTTAVYRWRDQRWSLIDRRRTGGSTDTDTVNAITIDPDSRAWFGSIAGIMMYADRQPSGVLSVPCPTNPVLDAGIAPSEPSVWLVTQTELRRIDLSQSSALDRCETWAVSQWTDPNFWTGADNSDYRLAIDAGASGALTLWVIQRDTDKVRVLHWRP